MELSCGECNFRGEQQRSSSTHGSTVNSWSSPANAATDEEENNVARSVSAMRRATSASCEA